MWHEMTTTPLRVLLLGYGGANNTGSEVRILTIIDDVRAAMGDQVIITVASVSPEKTRRFLSERENLRIVRIPYVFPFAIWRLTRVHDLTLLVEGSTFKDNWGSALLYAFLWAAWCSRLHGRKCIAYAVDAGRMRPMHQRLTRHVCGGIDLLITRTEAARQRLRETGVTRPVVVTTDPAFAFAAPAPAKPQGVRETVLGLAPVEFNQWPVRIRPWGPAEQCYRWPYYFSWDEDRAKASTALVDAWAQLASHAIRQHGVRVRLIAMEELDRRICENILAAIDPALHSHIDPLYSGELTPADIVAQLRGLDFLITSRYHACVLSMANAVPQAALYHDERLISIYSELGLGHLAIAHDQAGLKTALIDAFEHIVAHAATLRREIAERHRSFFMPRCRLNRELLRDWASAAFPRALVPVLST